MSRSMFLLAALLSVVASAHAEPTYRYRVPIQGSASATPAGQLSVSPPQLSFADLVVGQVSNAALVLQNTGQSAVALNSLTYSGSSSFLIDTSTCPNSLAASQMCAVGVTFAPQSRGEQAGNVSVRFDSGQLLVPLSGRGLQGALQADTASVIFDPVVVPGENAQALRIQNTGDASVSGINLSTQAPFSVGSGCNTITPGSSCELTLTFTPSAAGSFTGSLELSSPVGSFAVPLSGQGNAQTQTASLSQSLIDFGTVAQGSAPLERSITVTNTGNSPMSVTAVAGLPAGVNVASNTCSSVQPGANCAISLSLATGTLTEFVASPAQLSGPSNSPALALTGKVAGTQVSILSGAPVAFGSVVQGAAAPERSVTLSNTGNTAMTLTGLGNLPTGVTVVTNQCSGIAPSASCSIVLRLATDVARSVSGSASTIGASSNASFAISGAVEAATSVATLTAGSPVSFGSVTQGAAAVSRTVTLSNTGNSPMTLTGLSNLPSAVTVTGNTCSATAPGATCSLTLQMATASVTSFNQSATTQGATTAASIPLSGSVASAVTPVSATVTAQYAEQAAPPNNAGLIVRVTNKSGGTLSIVGATLCAGPQNNVLKTYGGSWRTLYNQNSSVFRELNDSCTMKTFSAVSWPNNTYTILMWEIADEYSGVLNSSSTLCANSSCYVDLRLSDGRTVRVNDSLQVSTY